MMGIAVLCLLPAIAASETIFDGWVNHEQQFVADGNEYAFFAVTKDGESAKLHAGVYGTLFFSRGESQEAGGIEVEYPEYRQKEGVTASENTDPRRMLEYHILIKKKETHINVFMETDKEYPYYLGTFTIIDKIQNKAAESIRPVIFFQELPETLEKRGDLEVSREDNGQTSTGRWRASLGDEHAIKWNGAIKSDESITIKQEVKVLHNDTSKGIKLPEASVTYDYQALHYNKTAHGKEVFIGDPLTIKLEKSKDEVKYGDKVRYTITLTNRHDEQDMMIDSLAVTLPKTAKLYSKSNELKQDKTKLQELTWSGKLGKKGTKAFKFDLEIYGGSENGVRVRADHEYSGLKLRKEVTDNSEIEIKDIKRSIIPNALTYQSGENATIKFSIENPNPNVAFQNGKIKLTSEIFPKEEHSFRINPRENKLVRALEITIPEVERSTLVTIHMDAAYETEYGVPFTFSEMRAITVNPHEQQLKAKQEEGKEKEIQQEAMQEVEEDQNVQENQENGEGISITETTGTGKTEQSIQTKNKQLEGENKSTLTKGSEEKRGSDERGSVVIEIISIILVISILTAGCAVYYLHKKKEERKKKSKTVFSIKEEITNEVQKILDKINK